MSETETETVVSEVDSVTATWEIDYRIRQAPAVTDGFRSEQIAPYLVRVKLTDYGDETDTSGGLEADVTVYGHIYRADGTVGTRKGEARWGIGGLLNGRAPDWVYGLVRASVTDAARAAGFTPERFAFLADDWQRPQA